jgi:hypothetical protein
VLPGARGRVGPLPSSGGREGEIEQVGNSFRQEVQQQRQQEPVAGQYNRARAGEKTLLGVPLLDTLLPVTGRAAGLLRKSPEKSGGPQQKPGHRRLPQLPRGQPARAQKEQRCPSRTVQTRRRTNRPAPRVAVPEKRVRPGAGGRQRERDGENLGRRGGYL